MFSEIKCGHPPIPVNAKVKLSSPKLTSGTSATYECDEGYETFGNTVATCSPIGQWIGELPFCGKIFSIYFEIVIFLI